MQWRIFTILIAAALGYAVFTLFWRPDPAPVKISQDSKTAQSEVDKIYGGDDLRILQFYSPSGVLDEGAQTTLCYGVVNAKSVRIEPVVDGVGVSINRCVAIAPERETTYKLIAEGADGKTVSQSVTVRTRPGTAAAAAGLQAPSIGSFKVEKVVFEEGRHLFTLSFQVTNAAEVHFDPPVLPVLHGTPHGTFYVKPEKTTTYTLTAIDKKGRKAQKRLIVKVPPE